MDETDEILDKLGYVKTPIGLPHTIEELEEFKIEAVRKAKEDLVEEFRDLVRECIEKGLATEMIDLEAIPKIVKKHNLDMTEAFKRKLNSFVKEGEE